MGLVPKLVLGGLIALLVALLAGAAALVAPFAPLQYQRASQRWQQQGERHYELEISWANGWNYGSARVEMRDGKVVRAIDPATGQPLAPNKQMNAGYFGSVDNLFTIIRTSVLPELNWRNLLAHLVPALAHRLVSCDAPLPAVSYDQRFGFPTEIWYNDSWCANTFFNYSNVKITNFRPLP